MPEIFCGVGKIPKKSRLGTMQECAEKGQVRYYGIKKIDPNILATAKDKSKVPETRLALMKMAAGLKGLIRRNKTRCEATKNMDEKDNYCKIWKDAEAKLRKVALKYKQLEAKEQKAKEKEKKSKSTQKKKSKSTPKKKSKSNKKTTKKKKAHVFYYLHESIRMKVFAGMYSQKGNSIRYFAGEGIFINTFVLFFD